MKLVRYQIINVIEGFRTWIIAQLVSWQREREKIGIKETDRKTERMTKRYTYLNSSV